MARVDEARKMLLALFAVLCGCVVATFYLVKPLMLITGNQWGLRYFDQLWPMIQYRYAGIMALAVSYIAVRLFFLFRSEREEEASGKDLLAFLALIVLNGITIRLVLASLCYGNYDMVSYEIVAGIVARGGNVYAETMRYNYSPVWFTVISSLKGIQAVFPAVAFYTVMRSFLTIVDLVTMVFLLLIARHERRSLLTVALFFFLNPVSFLLTGYHGQFENVALLMVVIGIFLYLKLKDRPVAGVLFLWAFATAGMIVKHNVFYELIICLHYAIRRWWQKILLFAVSVTVFAALFIPYWGAGSAGITRNVFGYSAAERIYGLTTLCYFPWLKYLFIAALFTVPLLMRRRDLVWRCMMGALFFLVFTTGISIQFLVLPVALGALRPSRGFLVYTLAASAAILGSRFNVHLPVFSSLGPNVVWIAAIYWFLTEFYTIKFVKK